MSDRKSLIQGLKTSSTADTIREKEFVYSDSRKQNPLPTPSTTPAEPLDTKTQPRNSVSRVPLTTRIREEYATALKRASLERQLNGIHPQTLQDILEDALEPWLRSNGYLK